MNEVKVSVPGKIHLIGEHTVVYNRPALIAAIDKRCFVKIVPRKDSKIKIISKNYKQAFEIEFEDLVKRAKVAREKWEKFINTNEISYLTDILHEPLDYPLLAIYETLKYYKAKKLKNGFSLVLTSEIPTGSGCGSSAAISVAIAAALTVFLGKKISKNNLLKIAIATEEYKHGTPSGGDPAVVLYGGLLWFQKNENGSKTIQPLGAKINQKVIKNIYYIDSGKPKETTGEMIEIVRKFKSGNPKLAENVFDNQKELTEKMLSALESGDQENFVYTIKNSELNLEKFGVVSKFAQNIISEIEKAGGAAKISGGGGKEKEAGAILVYAKDRKPVDVRMQKYRLKLEKMTIGEEGLRIE